jgi:predicted MFS family arabinose efflux permease
MHYDETTFTASNSSVSNVGVYAGSVIGGVLFLGAGVGFVMYKFRKKRIIR